MLYQLSHIIKDKLPFVWVGLDAINTWLFGLRYGRKLKGVPTILEKHQGDYVIREAVLEDIEALVKFFADQPEESYQYFKPHEFDAKTIKKLIKKKSYLFYIVTNEKQIVGYFFLRCFFIGKCFRGKIVDYRWRGKGIAMKMGKVSTDIAQILRLRMFGTISKNNVTSLASSEASNEIKIIEELPNDYLYIEYLPKIEKT